MRDKYQSVAMNISINNMFFIEKISGKKSFLNNFLSSVEKKSKNGTKFKLKKKKIKSVKKEICNRNFYFIK